MTSILPTIAAKSDQLNAEDLIGGPRTIRVTSVKVNTSDDQPVWVYFEGDGNKPYKPCKTMRRLLVRVWGDDSAQYPGRSMTIYLDPDVKYGGMAVGGVRISHMSDMDGAQSFYLTETRGKKKQHTVKPLKSEPRHEAGQKMPPEPEPSVMQDAMDAIDAAESVDALAAVWARNRGFQKVPAFVERKDRRKAELIISAEGHF